MSGSHVILSVSASAIELCVCRGRSVIAAASRRFDQSEWPDTWTDALETMRSPLTELVARLDAGRWPATVVYAIPGTFLNVHACPAAAGRGSARRGASLALSSLAALPLMDNPHEVRDLHADAGSVEARRNLHSLGVAELDEHASALHRWASSAGLRVQGLTPADAVLTVAAASIATRSERPVAALCVGEHGSVLTIGGAGRLELVRTIGAGLETLAEALTRPLRPTGGEPVTLTREAARALLGTVGVPGVREPLPGAPGCDGSSALPLIQPALQRIAVEIKQSLRFGIDEATRGGISLTVFGPGAGIPNLAAAIARQTGLEGAAPDGAGPAASIAQLACEHLERLPRLLSGESRERALVRGLRRALAAGVAAAAAMLVVQGVGVRMTLVQERARLASIGASTAGSDALQTLQDGARDRAESADALVRRVHAALGQSPAHAAVLEVLSKRTPRSMRLLEITMDAPSGVPTCRLRGYVRLDETPEAASEIRAMVDALAGEPLVEAVRLGVTQRAEIRGHAAQTFELNLKLVALPEPVMRATATAADHHASEEPAP